MQQGAAARGTPIGPMLAIAGGALLGIGSFLSWAKVSGGGVSVSATGTDGSDGWITLVAGLVAIVVGVAALRAGRRALAALAIVAGLVGGGLGLYDALTAKDSVLDAAAEQIAPTIGGTKEDVRAILDDAIDSGQLSITISFGLYIVIAGGALAIVGGAMQMARGGAAAAPMPFPAPTPAAAPAPSAPASGPPMDVQPSPPPAPPPPEAPSS